MSNTTEILKDLERQDIWHVRKQGMPQDLERQIKALCIDYMGAGLDGQKAIRSAITRKAGWFILSFAVDMATLAMKRKDNEALTLGIVALRISNILIVDYRDAYEPIAMLALAAQQCGFEPAEYTMLVCPDFPSEFLEWFSKPGPLMVVPDAEGSFVFQLTEEAKASKARMKEFLESRRQKRSSLKESQIG
jgi:hypothetical protein